MMLPGTPIMARIAVVMAQLNDAQRRTTELHLSRDSRAAAAQEAGCSPRQFADRLYYARTLLRQILNGQL